MSAPSMHSSIFLVYLMLIAKIAIAVAATSVAKRDCKDSCGNVAIPFPFGIGSQCSLDPWFEIFCLNENSSSPTILLARTKMEVLEISLETVDFYGYAYVRVKSPIISQNCGRQISKNVINFTGGPFFFSSSGNKIIATGCDNRATLAGIEPAFVGCQSSCSKPGITTFGPERTCNGGACCEIEIPLTLQLFNATFESKDDYCKLAFIVEEKWFRNNVSVTMTQMQSMEYVPVILRWGITDFDEILNFIPRRTERYSCYTEAPTNLTICYCRSGYEGNPYLVNGCQDVDECKDTKLHHCKRGTCVNRPGSYDCERINFWVILGLSLGLGVLLFIIAGWRFYRFMEKRRQMKLKKKFFKQNGGLLLQQQVHSSEGSIQKAKIFDSKELDKATDRFNNNRIIGKGGQGTVYKGMLVDGRIVAVKKSIGVDADRVEEFINEVAILSKINHKNVVNLIGCCLETEVPLLVYEFIPNGTLFQHLHDKTEEFHLTWEMRLKISIESAEAISYLHSSAYIPIYHRDIKSTNILLDEKYRAKVSDFGTSRSLAIDQTHLTTNVQGTFGYLDPEYVQSSQFTEKSDVYSFGVVLVELITGEKPYSIVKANEGRSLTTHFMLSMQENQLFEIVDARIMQEPVQEEIIATAKLAYRCLSLSGKKRPTMKEVAAELGRIQSLQKDTNAQQTHEEEVEDVIADYAWYTWEDASSSTGSDSTEMKPLTCSQKHTRLYFS